MERPGGREMFHRVAIDPVSERGARLLTTVVCHQKIAWAVGRVIKALLRQWIVACRVDGPAPLASAPATQISENIARDSRAGPPESKGGERAGGEAALNA